MNFFYPICQPTSKPSELGFDVLCQIIKWIPLKDCLQMFTNPANAKAFRALAPLVFVRKFGLKTIEKLMTKKFLSEFINAVLLSMKREQLMHLINLAVDKKQWDRVEFMLDNGVDHHLLKYAVRKSASNRKGEKQKLRQILNARGFDYNELVLTPAETVAIQDQIDVLVRASRLKNRTIILKRAIQNNHSELSGLLLDLGTHVSVDLLEIAAAKGDACAVKMLLAHGVDISDIKKDALICNAAEQNHFELVKVLLKFGADVGATKLDELNQTYWKPIPNNYPLRISAAKGYAKIVKLLLAYGADENVSNGAALRDAAANGHFDVVRILGGDNNSYPFNEGFNRAAENGRLNIVKLMLPKYRLSTKDALIFASKAGHVDIVELLLERGRGNDINTALYNAVDFGRANVVRFLLANGANARISSVGLKLKQFTGHMIWNTFLIPDAPTDDPDFLLRLACQRGHADVVEVLIANGADIAANNNQALYLAVANGKVDVIRVLIAHGVNVHENTDVLLLSVAMEEQLATVIQVLLDNGADVHANNDEALRCAARDGYEEIVLALLVRGANVHANGDEALRWAIYHEQVNIVRLLLAHGADGNAANGAALRETIMNQSDDSNILQMLLASGVDVHANNDEALRLAALYGRPSVIITLLDSVADFTKDCIDQVLRLAKLHRCGELIERKLLEYKNQHLAGADNVEVGAEPDNKRARLQ